MSTIISIGECMAELAPDEGSDLYRFGFGGDTLNTAVYLARTARPGDRVSYLTRLGDDPYSHRMATAWADEGIDIDLVEMTAGRTVGLYAIAVDEAGERSFTYWRDHAPARQMFTEGPVAARLAAIAAARLVYFSGITLAILPDAGRKRLLDAAAAAKATGAIVAFDPNHRPVLWPDREAARAAYTAAYAAATVALVGLEEDAQVFGPHAGDAVALRISGCGCGEVVLKAGAHPSSLFVDGAIVGEVAPVATRVIDTTAAGDSFNAAYLSARLRGLDPAAAARSGHALAAAVIAHPGAIIPADAMPVGA